MKATIAWRCRACNGFGERLLCQGEIEKGKALISWKTMCSPKNVGGLGLKFLRDWNEVLLEITTDKKANWMLSLKDKVRPHILYLIGNGQQTYVWDVWKYPMGWMEKFPILQLTNHLKYDSSKDDKVIASILDLNSYSIGMPSICLCEVVAALYLEAYAFSVT
ncbi:hypothetical protein Tco_0803824 [Tanacetum coccineum]|uniref:Uncharacterized protein n=1 Tax=Tanacetum coccineum TaxID=301880 RepID=A0ABQ5A5G2_9ASTR